MVKQRSWSARSRRTRSRGLSEHGHGSQRSAGRRAVPPTGTRKALFDLKGTCGPRRDGRRHQHLQALLWSPPRWQVEDQPELEFMFVAREVSPVLPRDGKRSWVIDEKWRVSADLLLMNVSDRTPIVAEFKRSGDQNAEYALIQALAAAAQLTPNPSAGGSAKEYSEYFGKDLCRPISTSTSSSLNRHRRGTRPKLLKRALTHATELNSSGQLSQWIRQIVFIEARAEQGQLTFRVLPPVEGSGEPNHTTNS